MDEIADSIARESLAVLGRLHPSRFILLGGGALRLFHSSPRASADLDFYAEPRPGAAELRGLADALQRGLTPLSLKLGTPLDVRPKADALEVRAAGKVQARLEFTAFARPRKVEKLLLRTGTPGFEVVVVPVLDELLFGKAVALLARVHPKGRDAFDIWYLLDRGARLDAEAFRDWLAWEEIDAARIAARRDEFSPRRLAADLDRYLPADLRRSLSETGYASIRAALAKLLEPFV